jgi:RNA polymerase sigma-70 factor (ECF subfamily)
MAAMVDRSRGQTRAFCPPQQARNESDAKDILQEVLIRAWKPKGKPRDSPPDLPLVFKKIREMAVDFVRKEIRRNGYEQRAAEQFEEAIDPVDAGTIHWLKGRLTKWPCAPCKNYPGNNGEVVVLKVWGGQSYREIGDALGVSQNTVASRYRYALEHLRRVLTPELEERL